VEALDRLPFVFACGRRAGLRTMRRYAPSIIPCSPRAIGDWAQSGLCSPRRRPRHGVASRLPQATLAGLDYALTETHLAGLTDFFPRLAARGLVPDGSLQFLQVA